MKADSIYFKGHSCFKKDWAGFDTIKPINVIIGRNNSGKSHLLDLVEALCGARPFDHRWQYRCSGVLYDRLLKRVFPDEEVKDQRHTLYQKVILPGNNHWKDHGQHFVDKKIIWEITVIREQSTQQVSNVKFPDSFDLSFPYSLEPSDKRGLIDLRLSKIHELLNPTTHQLNGTSFCRLLADRDIKIEQGDIGMELKPDGQGATNIIRRFILTSDERLPREVIQEELLVALNSIFGSDGQFLGLQVQVHDDEASGPINYWEICIQEKEKGWIPLSRSGSGLKTIILVLLNLLAVPQIPDNNNLRLYKEKSQFTFAFEELENNLHPALLRRLFQYLENYAVNEKATIFLTTHSSIALDFFGVSDNAQIIRVLHDGEAAHTETVHTHSNLIKVVSELGARPSDLLQANGLVWVEGPSDRIYLNRWIELYTEGRLREGRDYQCVFYGGALLARVEFKSPEDEANELANLFQINHNLIVVCDGDREAEDSDLKPRVERIREEVEKIDGTHIWITDAKEIENYLPGSVLEKVPDAVFKKATALSSLPDPGQYESWSSYIEKNMGGTSIDKVALAISSAPHTEKEVMEGRFDWKAQMEQIVERIDSWNGDSVST